MTHIIDTAYDTNPIVDEINLIVHNEVVKAQDWTIGELTSQLTQKIYEWYIEKEKL